MEITEAIGFIAPVPTTLALVQLFKMQGLPDRFAPLTSLGTGIGITAIATQAFMPPVTLQTGLLGLVVGLTASGVYSGVRAMTDAQS